MFPCLQTRAKLKEIVGGLYSPNLPINKHRSSPICQQIGLSMSFIINAISTSTVDAQQMCRRANYWRSAAPPALTPYGHAPFYRCLCFTRFYLRFPQFLGAWRVPLRGLKFWREHLRPGALSDVTNGLRWDSNLGPRWSEPSTLPLGHGCPSLLYNG